MKKKILFIDTDLGGDCDDVGALALANIFKNKGLIDIVGMTHTTSLEWGPACIDIVNRYYNNENIMIGATKREGYCVENTNKYAEKMANAFQHSYHNRNEVMDSVKFSRKVLSECEDNSITFVTIGQLGNISDLLDSAPDEYSPLNGVELIKQKVIEIVVMGGLFREENEKVLFCGNEYGSEYNIVCDIHSAQNFIKKAPVRVVFSDFKVGYQIRTCGPLLEQGNMNHPITYSYYLFQNSPRESWDLLTVWYAALGEDDLFTLSNNGHVDILDNGVTLFNENIADNHYYIRIKATDSYVVNRIDKELGGVENE